MSDNTDYFVPAGYGEAEFTEKRSRFTGRVWPVKTEEEALQHLKEMREKYWDATHNVYAYIIKETGAMRYSDDGEPQGTSGMPVLGVFRSAGVTDFCCVVTRYFGGILLGTGGLVRAYSQAASSALENAGIAKTSLWRRLSLCCPYPAYERVKTETESAGIIENTDFAADVTVDALVPEEQAEDFISRITDATSGAVRPETLGTEFRAVKITK